MFIFTIIDAFCINKIQKNFLFVDEFALSNTSRFNKQIWLNTYFHHEQCIFVKTFGSSLNFLTDILQFDCLMVSILKSLQKQTNKKNPKSIKYIVIFDMLAVYDNLINYLSNNEFRH